MPRQPQRWRNTSGEGGRRQARRSAAAKLDMKRRDADNVRGGAAAARVRSAHDIAISPAHALDD